MQVNVKTRFYEGLADVLFAVYATNPECTALTLLIPETGECLAIPTVNLEDFGMVPKENNVFIKAYSEGVGMYEALRDAGVVKPDAREFTFGPYNAKCFEAVLTDEAIKAMKTTKESENATS